MSELDVGVKGRNPIPIPIHSSMKGSEADKNSKYVQSVRQDDLGSSRDKSTRKDEAGSEEKSWNTKNLPFRLMADAAAAASAAVLVAPLIAAIDKGIMENASGKATLRNSITKSLKTLLLRPHAFLGSKAFALVFCVYGGTYLVANSIDTVSSTVRPSPCTSVTHGGAKFAGTSAANVSLSVWKDSHFTKMFGPSTAPRPIPLATYGLFVLRDSFTIFASFNLPAILAPHVPLGLMPAWLRSIRGSQQSVAQFVAPAAIQIFSTPVHLFGLDLYNNPKSTWGERFSGLKRTWAPSCLARVGRIVPAFGVGGVVNTTVRRSLMEKLV